MLGVLALQSRGKRILVLEDDPMMAQTLCSILNEQGYQTDSASCAGPAMEQMRTSPPGLLILDVGLPDKDGLAVAMELAADRRTVHIPILFLSGREDLAKRVRECRQLQCDYLRKPFGEQDLLARVERALTEAESRARLESDARIDDLTGLGNPRLLYERLNIEASRRSRYGTPLTIIVMDLDGLKQINDKHGHLSGSAVLRAVGGAIRHEIRETDTAFRYGGDEFVVLLPHTTSVDGHAFANRLLARIQALRPEGISISVSMGIAALDDSLDATIQSQLARADAATYAAKRMGGNRIVTASGDNDGQTPDPRSRNE